ncbi:hypothetical protein MAR_035189, partial [Mya arenaria]
ARDKMLVEWLHVTVATWLLFSMVPVARGNSFIDAYNQASNDLINDDTMYDNRADFFLQAVHETGLASSAIADAANFVNLLAIFLNVPTIEDLMSYDNFRTQLDTVVARINGICPLKDITDDFEECTRADRGSLWRPITGICNNIEHPRWGTPKIAQLRLAPAFWENVGLVVFDPLPDYMTPVDSRGVQLLPNIPLIFNLQGTNRFTLADGCEVDFDGSRYSASGDTCKRATICYQPFYVVIELFPRIRAASKLTINNEVVDTYSSTTKMYDATGFQTFWVRIQNDKLQVGSGSECDERTVILEGATDPGLAQEIQNTRHAISISAGQPNKLTAQFPVYDRIILETEPERPQSLASLPFLFESLVVRFGLRTPGAFCQLDNKHEIEFENKDTAEKLTVTFRATRSINDITVGEVVISFRRGHESAVEVTVEKTAAVPHVDFLDGSGQSHTDFSSFWVSAISNRVYAGAGNEVGKNAMIDLFLIPEGTGFFRPNDVIVRSLDGGESNPKHAQWMFDLKQWATPRKTSLTGRPLPTARDVSLAIHTNIGANTIWSDKLTMAVMQMGQFVDHDLIATPGET